MYKKQIYISYYASLLEKYVRLLPSLRQNIGKSVGRPNMKDIPFYIKHIINVLFSGISWRDLDLFLDNDCPKSDAIRKKHNKWMKLGIYDKVHREMYDLYFVHFIDTIEGLQIDSTLMMNINGTKTMAGFCQKLKSKRSCKNNFICDNNRIPYMGIISSSQPHDSIFIEPLIDLLPDKLMENRTYNKPLTITADSGYLINPTRNLNLRKAKHVSINAAYRKNMKKKKNYSNKQMLKKRHIIENVNAVVKRSYKRNQFIRDRNKTVQNTWFKITCTLIVCKFLTDKGKLTTDYFKK